MMAIGSRALVAFEIGDYWRDSKQHQHIDLWVGNKRITGDDNVVYLPTFYSKLENEILRLQSHEFFSADLRGLSVEDAFRLLDSRDDTFHRVLNYDLTVGIAKCFLYADGPVYRIVGAFRHPSHEPRDEIGKVFSAAVTNDVLIDTLRVALNSLSRVWV